MQVIHDVGGTWRQLAVGGATPAAVQVHWGLGGDHVRHGSRMRRRCRVNVDIHVLHVKRGFDVVTADFAAPTHGALSLHVVQVRVV